MPQNINGMLLYDTTEASERLKRKPRTVQRWCREGKLSARKYGNEYLILETELDTFIKRLFEPSFAGSAL